ncbi:MAG: hypothetical protein MJ245_05425 [Clostridia bacterium]|nr:hypothetical protein [Clostridia bacterium]
MKIKIKKILMCTGLILASVILITATILLYYICFKLYNLSCFFFSTDLAQKAFKAGIIIFCLIILAIDAIVLQRTEHKLGDIVESKEVE